MKDEPKIIDTGLELDDDDFDEREDTDMIVIHHTGSPDMDADAKQIHGWHIGNGWVGIGYHFVIRKNGKIERGRPQWAVGAHAEGENSHTIGIHLSGDFSAVKPTSIQIEKLALLIANLSAEYGITIDRDHIVGHGELMATDCPGDNLQALLDDGTITGKANYYRYGAPKEGDTKAKERYNTLDELPEWARPTIEKLTKRNILTGGGENLDLSLDMIRVFVVHDRVGLYD